MLTSGKNIAERIYDEMQFEQGFLLLKFKNQTAEKLCIARGASSDYIQFHFCLQGQITLYFQGGYQQNVPQQHVIVLYNPKRELPINMEVVAQSSLISILISIKKFHALISKEAGYIPFLAPENENKKYYSKEVFSSKIQEALHQILHQKLHPSIEKLYLKGKVYELLGLFFDRPEENEQCPFLIDETNMQKIKKAKEIIISQLTEPPTLPKLAKQVGLPLNKLKEGFKQIYGDSVYAFLLDYKLDKAKHLLSDGGFNVNEIGLKIGYSTSSHFIAAFKKKFGITPKKFMKNNFMK